MPSSATPEVADSYYQSLQTRVERWLAAESTHHSPCATLYRHLPDLYRFLLGLALDTRLPASERAGIVSTLKYIVAPYDFVPEAVLGTPGLCDDLVLAALAVDRLHETCDNGLLAEHWQLPGNLRDVARSILAAAGNLVDAAILGRLRALLPA
ncbi:MAG TPA: DUF1232 domain-containing protein [Thermoanaerobaculaceae bacterium]|nr:DUF1232 domain-containing protein [Thermoanaerobaculaceae bacterium]